MKTTIRKNYSVEIPGKKPVVIRQTSTFTHAAKEPTPMQSVLLFNRYTCELVEIEVPTEACRDQWKLNWIMALDWLRRNYDAQTEGYDFCFLDA